MNMRVKCKHCGLVMDKNEAIRVPVKFNYNEEVEYYANYCSARCFGKDLIISSDGAIAKLDLTDEQFDKMFDIWTK